MKRYSLILLILICSAINADLKDDLNLTVDDVIVMGGDSITAARMYSHYVATWLQLSYPELNLKIYEAGRKGTIIGTWNLQDTTPPVQSLYEAWVYPFDADVVFMMHGHNGGLTVPQHLATYTELANTWVHDNNGLTAATGTNLVILGMHPSQNATDNKYAESKADNEATIAAAQSDVFASDTFDTMGAVWLANWDNTIDVVQPLAEPRNGTDGVHPGPAGHIIIAYSVLKGLGVDTVVSQATIDASTGAVSADVNCTISSVTASTSSVSFDRLDERLPWAIDEYGRANSIALLPEVEEWQDYSITVDNLEAGDYTITCDGVELANDITHTEFAAGWNMADLTVGPVWEQGQDALDAMRILHAVDPDTGDERPGNDNTNTMGNYKDYVTVRYVNGDQRGATYKTNMQSVISDCDAYVSDIHTAAEPVTRSYVITKNGAGTHQPHSSPRTVDW
jgi:lysophospholipase L1-like esterase